MDEQKLIDTLQGLANAIRDLRQRMTTLEQRCAKLPPPELSAVVGQLRKDVDGLTQQQAGLLQRVEDLEESQGSVPHDANLPDFPEEEPGQIDVGPDFGLGGVQDDEKDKRAYLVGRAPKAKKVHLLVKVHDFKGKAIYVYNLLTGVRTQEANSMTRDIDARIARYGQIGHQIDHPGNIPYKDNQRWIRHARAESSRLGLTVGMRASVGSRVPRADTRGRCCKIEKEEFSRVSLPLPFRVTIRLWLMPPPFSYRT